MFSDGKDFVMSIVVSMGYCLKVVDKGGQGVWMSISLLCIWTLMAKASVLCNNYLRFTESAPRPIQS